MRWIPLLVLCACGVESEHEAAQADAALFAADMMAPPNIGGCGDASFYASANGDTRAIFVNINGLASDAHASSTGMVSGVVDLPHSDVGVFGQEGTGLTSATCVGAFPFPGPQVNTTWSVLDGRASYSATAMPGGSFGLPLATATVRLRNVVLLNNDTGAQITVPRLALSNVTVGFYPP